LLVVKVLLTPRDLPDRILLNPNPDLTLLPDILHEWFEHHDFNTSGSLFYSGFYNTEH
jgi:hypothetical protein